MSGKRVDSRAARESELQLQRLAPGSRHANADEQSRSGSRGRSGPTDRLRRHRSRRAKLGSVSMPSSVRLRELENDETLLVQSGKPVGKFRTHDEAPRVLIANSNLVGQWSNYTEFNRLERLGLTMYGQMTAGSWIYIGSQGIVQGTFETFARGGRKTFRRNARRQTDRHRRPRRNGRRATAGRDDEWRAASSGSKSIRRGSRSGWRADIATRSRNRSMKRCN